MSGIVWLAPPLVFIIFLAMSFGVSWLAGLVSAKSASDAPGKTRAYACGEDYAINRAQPDYNQFFPFAFFFTIMHVVALIITTVPVGVYWPAALYLAAAGMALVILFKR